MKNKIEKTIDWSKYFDRIWCINYIPYKNRKDAIWKEFERIGISNHKNFMWNYTFDSPLFDIGMKVLESNPRFGRLSTKTELKCWAGHYSCIKKSLAFGDNRILIIEDDSRFLNDVGLIYDILENMPENYDIVMFDYFVNVDVKTYESYRKRKINEFYSEYDNLNSTGCYSLSINALKSFADAYETYITVSDGYISDHTPEGLRKCFSLTNLSCQATYSSSMSVANAGVNTIHRVYSKSNIIYSNYNMNDGKPYDYGDFIKS